MCSNIVSLHETIFEIMINKTAHLDTINTKNSYNLIYKRPTDAFSRDFKSKLNQSFANKTRHQRSSNKFTNKTLKLIVSLKSAITRNRGK